MWGENLSLVDDYFAGAAGLSTSGIQTVKGASPRLWNVKYGMRVMRVGRVGRSGRPME